VKIQNRNIPLYYIKERMMKKILLIILIMAVATPMILLGGAPKEEKPAMEEKPAVVTETGGDEIDPWIQEMRAGLNPYRGKIHYKGEYGQTPTWDTGLFLTVNEVKRCRETKAKVGFVLDAAAGDYTTAQLKGLKDVLNHLGMQLVSVVDPQFDTAKERAGAEDLVTMGADIIIGGPIDAIASAESFRPVLDAGKKFVIWSNIPKGYEYGRDYVGVTSAMAQDLGVYSVDLLKKGVTGRTEVCYLYFDAVFWVVNLIDSEVKKAIEADPNLVIVEELGYASEAQCFDLVNAAIQRHPNIKRIYGGWMVPAQFAANACQQQDRPDIKIACFGVDEPTLVNILTGGNIVGTIEDDPYHIGANLGLLCGYAAIGKKAPEFTITPAVPVTKDNVIEAWKLTRKTPVPKTILDLAGK
jgi:ribose transport system substrate-binding protein